MAVGGRLEVVAADLSQRQTLLPEMFEGVRAVVSCHAVKVQPKEGDTVDRKKYYQVWCVRERGDGGARKAPGTTIMSCVHDCVSGSMHIQSYTQVHAATGSHKHTYHTLITTVMPAIT